MQFSLYSSKMEMQFFLYSSKMESNFVCILTIDNNKTSYVKHVLDPLCAFFTLFGFFRGRGGSQGGRGTTCSCIFPSSAAQKWKFPKLFFFNILTIDNVRTPHVKHVFHPIHVLCTLFGCLDWGKGLGHNLLMQFSTLSSSKIEIFGINFFDILPIHSAQISYPILSIF